MREVHVILDWFKSCYFEVYLQNSLIRLQKVQIFMVSVLLS